LTLTKRRLKRKSEVARKQTGPASALGRHDSRHAPAFLTLSSLALEDGSDSLDHLENSRSEGQTEELAGSRSECVDHRLRFRVRIYRDDDRPVVPRPNCLDPVRTRTFDAREFDKEKIRPFPLDGCCNLKLSCVCKQLKCTGRVNILENLVQRR